MAKVEKFLARLNQRLHLDDDRFYKLLVATTEAVNNGIVHGNKRDPSKKVVLTCVVKNSNLIICVRDEGEGFDFASLPDPLAEENLLRDHGRGVFLIRSLMDHVEFHKTPEGSEVVMTMNINRQE